MGVYINNGRTLMRITSITTRSIVDNGKGLHDRRAEGRLIGWVESVSRKQLADRTNRGSLCSRFIDGPRTNGVVSLVLFCARCGATARSKASFRFHAADFDERNARDRRTVFPRYNVYSALAVYPTRRRMYKSR